MDGMRKAKVFPEPVRAAPRTSRPERRGGMVRAWTSVMVVKLRDSMADRVWGERLREEKGRLVRLVPEEVVASVVSMVGGVVVVEGPAVGGASSRSSWSIPVGVSSSSTSSSSSSSTSSTTFSTFLASILAFLPFTPSACSDFEDEAIGAATPASEVLVEAPPCLDRLRFLAC